ncbi:MAG: S41 family peptidase [Oscillospiraceae bacterium]|nr:S41 family peptidase [Oscillospiraceae bacterium]
MNKKISVGIAISFVLIAVTITFTAAMIFSMKLFDNKVSSAQERASMYEKLSEIDNVARQNFYKSIDSDVLSDSLARGYIDGLLDPDSAYLTAEEVAARTASASGTKITLGFETEKDKSGYMLINKIYNDSSAQKMGLEVGDVVKAIGGEDVLAAGYDAAVLLLDGVEGSKIKVTYNKSGEENTAELTRSTVEAQSVEYTQVDDVFYIRINLFCNTTANQFATALSAATAAENVVGLVIDVRDLHGGYDVGVAASLLDMLLPTGKLITGVYSGNERKVLYTSDDNCVTMPISVIVNENTVGFSELFAAVLADSSSCRIVGKTTAGKGTLQQLVKLNDGSAVDITIAELETPGGTAFNETGVKPAFDVDPLENFVRTSTPDAATDAQFKKALEVVRSIA